LSGCKASSTPGTTFLEVVEERRRFVLVLEADDKANDKSCLSIDAGAQFSAPMDVSGAGRCTLWLVGRNPGNVVAEPEDFRHGTESFLAYRVQQPISAPA
jgi:hypothetical protein